METYIILIKLLCAHLCADFIFQTDGINQGKRKAGMEGVKYQLLHSVIHAATAYLFVADWTNMLVPLGIFVSHIAIDMVKCRFFKDTLLTFLADQLGHVAVISALWLALYGTDVDWSCIASLCSAKMWLVVTAYVLMLRPSSIMLSLFLKKWTPESPGTQSLPNAGQWIGYIERILILTFVLVGSFEGVGFLMAAKSVFRFGELSKAKEIRTTEYVPIGTLASFTIAIITGIIVSTYFLVITK